MAYKHIAEVLIELNKKMSNVINQMQSDAKANNQNLIEELNNIIRGLDHIVEELSITK